MSDAHPSTCVSRLIAAPPKDLYDAFLDPQGMAAWLPPGEMTGKFHRFDARAGGGYEMSLFYPDDEKTFAGKTTEREDRVTVRFVQLEPPVKIVQAVTFHSDNPAFAGEMCLEIVFEAKDGATEVTICCKNLPPGLKPEDNETGTRETLDNLARYVE